MSTIQFNTNVNPQQFIQEVSSELTPEQLQNFISILANSNPPLISLPEGKTFSDIQKFSIIVHEGFGTSQAPASFIYLTFKP